MLMGKKKLVEQSKATKIVPSRRTETHHARGSN